MINEMLWLDQRDMLLIAYCIGERNLISDFPLFFSSIEKLLMLIKEKPGLPMKPTGNCERIRDLVK